MSEEAYVKKKVTEYNEKTPGRGDEWVKVWESDKEKVYPASFCDLFAKYSKIETDNLSEKPYTVEVNTDFFESGFNVGVVRRNASINVTVIVYETANPQKVLARLTVVGAPGRSAMGYDFSVSNRVSEAYAKAAKEVGKLISKFTK